ncbi:MAG: tetratricopeptide repeat protein [Actinomycetota bacterium]|nr:tetratricopeptide repeat protein [Actinomycetota bacterium]
MKRLVVTLLVGSVLFLVAGSGIFRVLRTDESIGLAQPEALTAPIAMTGSLEQTIADLQAHLATQPDDAHALASLGIAYAQDAVHAGDPSYYPKAEEALQRSLAIQPDDNVDALVGMGVVANARHDFADGVRWGREAAALNPDAAHILGVVGDGLLELGRYRAAFATFQRMVQMRPDVASYARVSYARELRGDVPGALRVMEQAFRAAGTSEDAAWVSYQIGELSFRAGRLAPAEHAYRRSVALAPTFIPAHAGLAKIAWARGDVDRAIRGYRRVVARYPLPEHVIALGDLYTVAGHDRQAADAYALARAEAALFRANGVNVDVEQAVFEADHGDPPTALSDARAGWQARKSIGAADALAWALYRDGRYRSA